MVRRPAVPDKPLAEIPSGPAGESIVHGRALFSATRDSLPANDSSRLNCASCHLDAGLRAPLSLRGVYARYPQYRARSVRVETLEDRINDCFTRSLHGAPLDPASPQMRAIVSYLAYLSAGTAVTFNAPSHPPAAVTGDSTRGRAVYRQQCARCHAADGSGSAIYPPLWGSGSFTIGAGMARTSVAAEFIAANMPFDRPGTLQPRDADDVAAYITSRARPDFPGKSHDWPMGGAPTDLPYSVAPPR